MTRKMPVRVLQAVGGMDQGGVETWLVHVLEHIDRDMFKLDFLVNRGKSYAYSERLEKLGAKIIPCVSRLPLLGYAKRLQSIISSNGPYDVVHSHQQRFSGIVLSVASVSRVPTRIVHAHSDTSMIDQQASPVRRAYLTLMDYLIYRSATMRLACSEKAGTAMFGVGSRRSVAWSVMPCGINLNSFKTRTDRIGTRASLNLKETDFVIGHVGRFAAPKNHGYLLDIFHSVVKRKKNSKLVLIGDGPLRSEIEEKIRALRLGDHVIIAGFRTNVADLLRALDVFLFPSIYEGMPLALIEAQAAGLCSFVSDSIDPSTDVVKQLVRRLSIRMNPDVWAQAIVGYRDGVSISQEDAVKLVCNSPFSIENSVRELSKCYSRDQSQKHILEN